MTRVVELSPEKPFHFDLDENDDNDGDDADDDDEGHLQIATVIKVGGRLASQLKGARGQVDICCCSDNQRMIMVM